MFDVINNDSQIFKPLVTNLSAMELELIELQQDIALEMIYKSHTQVDFWKHVQETKYPELKKFFARILSISAPHTLVNHYSS